MGRGSGQEPGRRAGLAGVGWHVKSNTHRLFGRAHEVRRGV